MDHDYRFKHFPPPPSDKEIRLSTINSSQHNHPTLDMKHGYFCSAAQLTQG
jgi:hypothetical protein